LLLRIAKRKGTGRLQRIDWSLLPAFGSPGQSDRIARFDPRSRRPAAGRPDDRSDLTGSVAHG
jgi:hypothetical protein